MDSSVSVIIIFGLFFVFFLIGSITSLSNASKIKNLERELFELKRRLVRLVSHFQRKDSEGLSIAEVRNVDESAVKSGTEYDVPGESGTKPKMTVGADNIDVREPFISEIPVHARVERQRKKSELAVKIEKSVLENWTGIIGSVIVVAGLSFLGVFIAMNMNPFVRFLLLVGVSIALAILSFALHKSIKVQKLGFWVRSIAAATFLFACVGGGGIEGLRWIDNPYGGLALLSLGIAVNIGLAYIGKNRIVASIHVTLSLLTLFITPQNEIIFAIASVICLSGVVLTYREKWEFHLLLTIVEYAVYFMFYFFSRYDGMSFTVRIEGIVCVATVHLTALFVHYGKLYSESAFKPVPLIAHLVNWLLLGLGMFVYTPDVYWISIPLFLSGIAAFFLARSAKRSGIRWLYILDTLMSQAIVYIGIVFLVKWNLTPFPIAVLFCFSVLAFLAVAVLEKEPLLSRIGSSILIPAICGMVAAAFATFERSDVRSLVERSVSLLVCVASLAAFHVFALVSSRKVRDDAAVQVHEKRFIGFHVPAQGIMISLLLVVIYILLIAGDNLPWYTGPDYFLLIPVLALAFVRLKIQSDWLGIGLLIMLVFTNCAGWLALGLNTDAEVPLKLIAILPSFAMNAFAIVLSYAKRSDNYIIWPGIYLLFAHAAVSAYFILSPVSGPMPSVAWLLLSIVALESARIVRRKIGDDVENRGSPDRFLLNAGYLLVLAFLVIHITVNMASEEYILIFRVRHAIEVFALLVFIYWGSARKPGTGKIWKSWIDFHSLFLELILVFIVFTVAVEVKQEYLPICWIGLGIVSLTAGFFFKRLSRLRLHSVFLFWASAIHVAFVTSPAVMPSVRFSDEAWIFGVIAILVELCYIVLFHKMHGLDDIDLPPSIAILGNAASRLNERRNLWIYFPLFVCIGLFLVWSFDESILTLLLSMEAFAIFGISIILKESSFRYFSLVCLAACLVRLVFFDLAESNTIVRAVVFIGVGSLMLLMNALYNRFKHRYKK